MQAESEREIAQIVGDPEKVRQVLDVIHREEAVRRAAFVRRQAAGIAAARSRGVPLGRPRKPIPPEIGAYYWAVRRGEMTVCAAAREMNMSRWKMTYQLGRYAEENGLDPPKRLHAR